MHDVLIIEDDASLAEGLRQALGGAGYRVHLAADGDQGLHAARTLRPTLVVLDVMMPQLNGFEVITELRREGVTIPILVLSARNATRDKVRGLDLGADDYLPKPFELDELLARVRRLLARGGGRGILTIGRLSFDQEKRLLTAAGDKRVALTAKELRLLEFFVSRDQRVLSRQSILNAVWGDDYDGTDRTVDNLILALRQKLGDGHIETVRGEGYRFVMKP